MRRERVLDRLARGRVDLHLRFAGDGHGRRRHVDRIGERLDRRQHRRIEGLGLGRVEPRRLGIAGHGPTRRPQRRRERLRILVHLAPTIVGAQVLVGQIAHRSLGRGVARDVLAAIFPDERIAAQRRREVVGERLVHGPGIVVEPLPVLESGRIQLAHRVDDRVRELVRDDVGVVREIVHRSLPEHDGVEPADEQLRDRIARPRREERVVERHQRPGEVERRQIDGAQVHRHLQRHVVLRGDAQPEVGVAQRREQRAEECIGICHVPVHVLLGELVVGLAHHARAAVVGRGDRLRQRHVRRVILIGRGRLLLHRADVHVGGEAAHVDALLLADVDAVVALQELRRQHRAGGRERIGERHRHRHVVGLGWIHLALRARHDITGAYRR